MRLPECTDHDEVLPLVLRPKPLVLCPRDKVDSGQLAAEAIELRPGHGYVAR